MDLKGWLRQALQEPYGTGVGSVFRVAPLEKAEDEAQRLTLHLGRINKIALEPLRVEDVEIFGANFANNVIDYYDSRFSDRGLKQLAAAAAGTPSSPGSPIALGHDMGGWGYAAMFETDVLVNDAGARVRELRDMTKASWARGHFFFPKAASWAPDLATRIRAGLTREMSAHWTFDKATCSVCEQDIRGCEHFPGEEYEKDGKKSRCFYEMEGVVDYLETSFVVRGGQRATSIWSRGGDGESAACRIPFGDAIREMKSRREWWAEWERSFRKERPSEKRSAESAVSWLRGGMAAASRG